ncbi:FMN-binding protein [Streptomyces sp. NBC_00151]|uniref:FMN-binding protein n=1 Tax=Streptomyces sp. NBC_00151 TaxID=2975669 RepID=UPI002DDC45F7|nr:FMN-binding protein [Streptomyces sp. NBC_00151]WRZ42879.1 FMN-binding protein [Streptomyces sp. NBC_00151]
MKTNHPIRRFVLASAATVSGIVLLLALKPATDPAAASAQVGAAPQQTAAGQGAPQGGTAQQSGTATVLGDVVQTQYGPVQVQLTMSGGKITKADAVQAPKGGTSDQKTALSVPKLNQETLAAQSADIDAVSGATYTSGGYKKSLQSALDKAKAAGGASGSSGSSGKAGASPAAPAAQARVVTGAVTNTQYGPVQVRLTLAGKKITKAEAVQAPSGGTSSQKTELAVPKLNQEAVAAGSAQIDTVSGATYTSEGYKKSLQSALDKAGV